MKTKILGVPYVFARKKLRKPFHAEVVTLTQRPALCHNACGLYYIPTIEQLRKDPRITAGVRCPTCGVPPKDFKIGEVEEIEVMVRMQFGNVVDISFLRALGPVGRKQLGVSPVTSGVVGTNDMTKVDEGIAAK